MIRMREQGRITDWKDDRGFGFITPNEGGGQVFVHVKAFSRESRRPVGGELVFYELATDERGRSRAENVVYVGQRAESPLMQAPSFSSILVASSSLAFIATVVLAHRLPIAVGGLYLGASAAAFLAYGRDKAAAQKGAWRTSESTLLLLGLTGGWPGAFLAQSAYRHKSKKVSFQVSFWITVVVNCGMLGWLLTEHGGRFIKSIMGTG